MNDKKNIGTKVIFFLILGAAASSFLVLEYRRWIGSSSCFHIRGIEIFGNDLIRREELLKLADLRMDIPIWQVDLKEAENNLRSNPFLEKVSVSRRMPDCLQIFVEEKSPLALLNFGGTFYCLDRDGLVLPSKPGRLYDLPVLNGRFEGAVTIGSRADSPWVNRGLEFLKTVLQDRPELLTRISEVVLGSGEGIVLRTHRGGIPVWIGSGKHASKIRCLEVILNELEWEISRVEYIDLRFEGQVVVGMRT